MRVHAPPECALNANDLNASWCTRMHANARNCDAAHRHATATGARMQHLTECDRMRLYATACQCNPPWMYQNVSVLCWSRMHSRLHGRCRMCKHQMHRKCIQNAQVVKCKRMEMQPHATRWLNAAACNSTKMHTTQHEHECNGMRRTQNAQERECSKML